jgi:peptide/nickel transport system permease protein
VTAYIGRRLLAIVPTLWLVSVVTFALAHLMPGDPALALLGESAPRDQVAYQAIRKDLGLDRPVVVQYGRWIERVVRGNLGISVRSQTPVAFEIFHRLPITLELTFLGMLAAAAIALPTGILAALRPGTRLETTATLATFGGLAIPDFWLGILLIYLFAVTLRVLPPSGFTPLAQDPVQNVRMMVLPALALGLGQAAIIMRQVYSGMVDVLHREYVTTARAKGLSEWIVVWRHALRNAMIPVITILGLQIGRVFGTAVVIEVVFSLPGLARLAVDSAGFRDYSALQGAILTFALTVLLVNLVTDCLYGSLDPRIRYQ